MTLLSGLGIVLSLVFGCLLLALVAELYYLLWWKKQRISSDSNRMEEDYSNHTKELFYLFCWDKPTSVNNPNPTTIVANPEANRHDPDVELGLGSSKDLLLKALGEEGVESEIMRLHNLAGPPRFLFTIKEETKEDLESDDGKSRGDRSRKGSRTRSLSDLIMALETQTPYLSPMASPPLKGSPKFANNNYNNPLFESSMEAELYRLRSSPPPKFKFLRDAEEKLYRRLLEEAQKSGILQEVVLDNPPTNPLEEEKNGKDGYLMMKCKAGNGGMNKEREVHCSSQGFQIREKMGKIPVKVKAVQYALSPYQQKVMPGLWKDLPGKISHKVSENWLNATLLLTPLVGIYSYVQWFKENEKQEHRRHISY